MTAPSFSNARYLASKKTVDDRALNKDVIERLRAELALIPGGAPRILECGAGLGTMIARLVDWGVIARAEWWLLDVDAEMLAASRDGLLEWARGKGHSVAASVDSLRITAVPAGIDLTVRTIAAELGDFLATTRKPPVPRVDLVLANAFLDLVDLPSLLPALLALAAPMGLFWFSINYDGDTIFEPPHPSDTAFLDVYHRSMDERIRHGRPAGHSQTGRRLIRQLASAGGRVLAGGSSDWVVFADAGRYPSDEAYFLHAIISTIAEELARHSELEPVAVADWVSVRHEQIERGDLVLLAHQIDVVGRTHRA